MIHVVGLGEMLTLETPELDTLCVGVELSEGYLDGVECRLGVELSEAHLDEVEWRLGVKLSEALIDEVE